MRDYRKISLLLILTPAVIGITATAALHSQEQSKDKRSPQKSQKMINFESQLPVADYSAPEPTDEMERDKRRAKGKKYDKTELTVDPYSDVVTTSSHWASGLPAIPVERSSLIIVGSVLDAKAYMSPSKEGVYSEFTISIEEVLKNGAGYKVAAGKKITIDRIGGRVQFSNGKVGQYFVTGQGMPLIGRRYLFFLTSADQDSDYDILTGYELRNGQVYLLDNPGAGHPITRYEGADESTLLNDVRAALSAT